MQRMSGMYDSEARHVFVNDVAALKQNLTNIMSCIVALNGKVDRIDGKVDRLDGKVDRIEGMVALLVRHVGLGYCSQISSSSKLFLLPPGQRKRKRIDIFWQAQGDVQGEPALSLRRNKLIMGI